MEIKIASMKKMGKAKHKGAKVSHIHIRKAKNGFIVRHEREQTPMNGGRGPMMPQMEQDPAPAVFNDHQAAMDHVGGLMGQMGGDEPTPGAPAAA
jgi:hypothetical protein